MVGKLRECLGVVATTTIVATIYLRDGAIFQVLPSNFVIVYCLEISKENLITRVSWTKLLATPK
jgi:hypothetical protein